MKYLVLSFLLLSLTLISCSSKPVSGSVDAAAFQKLLKEDTDPAILDVRTPEEFAEGHIANAVNMDYYADSFDAGVLKLDKNKTWYIYCQEGGRSKSAFELMQQNGFNHLVELNGGFAEWTQAGFEVAAPGQ